MSLFLVGVGFAKALYDTNKSMNMDEKALKRYAQAFEKGEEADRLIREKAEFTDQRLMNVVKKKKAIIQNTVPQFVEVYGKIQKLNIQTRSSTLETAIVRKAENLVAISSMPIATSKELNKKEFAYCWLTGGIGKFMVKESERYLSAANNQMRAANIAESQSRSIAEAYDAVVARADRISNLLMAMNALFIRSIRETDATIERNGFQVHRYSEEDKGILMTCVNIASAVSDIIDVPVLDENGKISQTAAEMIATGEKYLKAMTQAVRS